MNQYLILAANNTQARFFLFDRAAGQLEEVSDLIQDSGRQRERELDSDRPGRKKGGDGSSHHSLNTEDESREHENLVFARHIAGQLEKDRVAQSPEGLVILAPPHFLGILRHELSGSCQNLVVQTVNKNLVQSPIQDILDHIDLK